MAMWFRCNECSEVVWLTGKGARFVLSAAWRDGLITLDEIVEVGHVCGLTFSEGFREIASRAGVVV